LAVDVGGTFIDYVLLEESSGELVIEKQRATPGRLADELLDGLRRLPAPAAAINQLCHGTTVALNAIIQERGARVGLLTTAGFRDVLEVGRGGRPEMYNFLYVPPPPLVPRYLRREVVGRVDARGKELMALDLESVDREVDALVGMEIESLAICFLHSYANPTHERRAADRVMQRHPELPVTTSSEVVREWREYDRTSTVALNAYIRPFFESYVSALEGGLQAEGYDRPLAVMQSNGGVISASRAAALPVRTLDSGPAGGVIGAHALARRLHLSNVICSDVGGTSYDVALIHGGEILEKTRTTIGDRPVLGPSIDIASIGAGGGSIAWLDRGSVRVGPQSAGADPGPASFGLGGTAPTVTDCHLVLGRLDPERFLGSRMRLHPDAARRALETDICEPTGMSVDEAAAGILAVAETNMMYAIRMMTVERGLDPREFALLAYGGGGGLFATATAAELEIGTVIIPRAPANFSAWGILTSDYREDASATRVRRLIPSEMSDLVSELHTLTEAAIGELERYGFGRDAITITLRADLRYLHQEHTVTIPVSTQLLTDGSTLLTGLREAFVKNHRQLYGHGQPDAPMELVTVRCRATGHVAEPEIAEWPAMPPPVAIGDRRTYFPDIGTRVPTPVYRREDLGLATRITGPAIIEEWTTTILIPPGWGAEHDNLGNLLLEPVSTR
jgi:N-methylhydantoinase A